MPIMPIGCMTESRYKVILLNVISLSKILLPKCRYTSCTVVVCIGENQMTFYHHVNCKLSIQAENLEE